MTSGERMVWAAEFVRVRAAGDTPGVAAVLAQAAVASMRSARGHDPVVGELNPDARVMLDDMLSNGGDR